MSICRGFRSDRSAMNGLSGPADEFASHEAMKHEACALQVAILQAAEANRHGSFSVSMAYFLIFANREG